jgi:hypothetical protein
MLELAGPARTSRKAWKARSARMGGMAGAERTEGDVGGGRVCGGEEERAMSER